MDEDEILLNRARDENRQNRGGWSTLDDTGISVRGSGDVNGDGFGDTLCPLDQHHLGGPRL